MYVLFQLKNTGKLFFFIENTAFVLLCYSEKRQKKTGLSGPADIKRKNGAPTGTRTQDPMIKSHLLYQLSYGRKKNGSLTRIRT